VKLLLEDIQVHLDSDRSPERLLWRRRPYRVKAVLEEWCYTGQWWRTTGLKGCHRHYYRLACLTASNTSLCLEIFHENRCWKLSRVLD
jgi:hypothetical protein